MFEIIFISFTTALALLIWFNTEAFIEYATLAGGRRFFLITAYKDKQKSNPALTYHDYLLSHHNNFFTRLITCPFCLSFWITLVITFFMTEALWLFPICNVLSLISLGLVTKLNEH